MIDLEERLRRAGELLDQEAIHVRLALEPTTTSPRETDRRTWWLARVAAVAILVVGAAGVAFALSRTPGDGARSDAPPGATDVPTTDTTPVAETAPATSAPDPMAPLVTLPPLADLTDVPVTVAASGPTDWYRLQPDLDVAWYRDTSGEESMLCFRSPSVAVSCQSDVARPTELGGGPIAIEGGGGQFLLVVVDEVEPATISAQLDDGSVVTGAADTDALTGWSVARVTVPPGHRPMGMWMSFLSTHTEGPGMSVPPEATAPDSTAPPTSAPTPSVATTAPPPP